VIDSRSSSSVLVVKIGCDAVVKIGRNSVVKIGCDAVVKTGRDSVVKIGLSVTVVVSGKSSSSGRKSVKGFSTLETSNPPTGSSSSRADDSVVIAWVSSRCWL